MSEKEYIGIHKSMKNGDYLFCDSSKLHWFHRIHVKPRIWLAKKLLKSCTRHASQLSVRTITGTVDFGPEKEAYENNLNK